MTPKGIITGLAETLRMSNRFSIIFNRLALRNTICVYKLGKLEFIADHAAGDANGLRMCLTTNMYNHLLDTLDLPDTPINVIDIGANSGGFSLLLIKRAIAIKSLLAVEMHPETFARLQYNLTHNYRNLSPETEIHCVEAAICGQSGQMTISLGRGSTGDSLYANSETQGRNTRVKCLTIDQLAGSTTACAPVGSWDLCKIDIEGAEFDILDSNQCSALGKCRNLIIEIHSDKETIVVKALGKLATFGFDVVRKQDADNAVVVALKNRKLGA
jgi:FkbM family methyltransferase